MVITPNSCLRGFAAAIVAGALCATALPASAGSSTNNLTVTASVIGDCIIGAATLAFGNYDPTLTTATTATTSVSVTCTKGVGTSIALGAGGNYAGGTRSMADTTSGDPLLNYTIYQPTSGAASAACASTTAWGDGTSATGSAAVLAITVAPSIAARSYNICGSIPAAQSVPVNSTYKDTVLETINF